MHTSLTQRHLYHLFCTRTSLYSSMISSLFKALLLVNFSQSNLKLLAGAFLGSNIGFQNLEFSVGSLENLLIDMRGMGVLNTMMNKENDCIFSHLTS